MYAIVTIIKSEWIAKRWNFATEWQRTETIKYNHLENEKLFLNHTRSKMLKWLFKNCQIENYMWKHLYYNQVFFSDNWGL